MPAARVAIVSTVRNPGPSIRSFVRYHLASGVERIFLFFDDPADPWVEQLPDDDRVSILLCDEELRACWADWPEMRRFVDTEVMARQSLNAELALQLARSDGFDWLLHLDADELLDVGDAPIGEHLARFAAAGVEQVTFSNCEVVPETDEVEDLFAEMTLFKRNRRMLPDGVLGPGHRALMARIPQLPAELFFYYNNGKSAVRVAPGVRPAGPHHFALADGSNRAEITNTPRILHYMNAGFENFWRRYQTWGRFPDTWFGQVPIRDLIGDFHLAARDIVAIGDRTAARQFYRERVVLADPALISALIAEGLCERIEAPARLLSSGPSVR
jgi:glycosyl transferase family 2